MRDRIIQIALKHSDGREWSSFINPGRSVPLAILQLTGFEGVDFTVAPTFPAVCQTVREYLVGARLVGHNVRFDQGFLTQEGIDPDGSPLDTLEWSRLAYPLRTHHGLMDWFSETDSNFHDARIDVQLTEKLLHQIYARLTQCSLQLKRDLALFLGHEWNWWDIPLEGGRNIASPLYSPASDGFEASPLDVVAVDGTAVQSLGAEGMVAQSVSGFEVRPAQQEMAHAVEEAIEHGQVLLVQAGTGTGKSLAYLTPAVLTSLSRGERTVVATHTVALQEQLWFKDVPQVAHQWPVQAALVKGRGRYLCLYKASEVVQDSAVLGETRERRWALATLLSYIEATELGDAEEFPLKNDVGKGLWREVMADSHSCAGARCPYAGPCFMRRARHAAESSHLVIVNHALLAAHVANGNILPEFSHLIVDEAHHFAEVLENTLGFELDGADWERRYKEVIHPSRGLLERLKGSPEMAGALNGVRSRYQDLGVALKRLGEGLAMLTPPGEYDRRSVRITASCHELLAESGLIEVWHTVVDAAKQLTDLTEQIWEEAQARGSSETALWLRFRQWQQDLIDMAMGLSLWGELSSDRVSWWEVRTGRQGDPLVCWRWAPVDIAGLVNDRLWSALSAAVLTSATLSVRGRFDYMAASLGIPEKRRVGLTLASPFDWSRQARLIVPNDSPDPRDVDYLDRLADLVCEVAAARSGRTLVLLTSYRAVEGLAWRIRPVLELKRIRTMAQNIDGPARRLVSEFREDPQAVLLGTLTYWEGVDIPGDNLEVVVMGRLPFRMPGDPLEEAKLDKIRESGHSPFYRRSLPEAVLRFQQGFGRLIRTKSDRGVVIVFDPRVNPSRSRYGQVFLEALEDVPRLLVPSSQVLESITKFWEDGQ